MNNLSPVRLFKISIIPLILFSFYASGQTITKNTSSVVSGTVCPSSPTSYSVSTPSNFGTCKIKWTVTNGAINGADNERNVSVTWNDTPGATSTVTVTFSGCASGNSNEAVTSSKSELILSIKNQPWGSYGTSVNIDYCTRAQVNLSVPRMFVQGTGGVAEPQLTEVSYGWTVPIGWQQVGTNKTGFFGTNTHFISIEPLPNTCSKPGNVTVYGTLVGAGPFCNSAANSGTATIALTGTGPTFAISAPGGATNYALQCGNTSAVTFTATPINCAISYTWTFPAGWLSGGAPSPVITTANTISLTPPATPADSSIAKGSLTVTANLGVCNLQTSLMLSYNDPKLATPVFTAASTKLLCSGGSGTITINPIAQASIYTWYTQTDLTIYLNGAVRTSATPLVTTTPNITVSVPAFTTGYANTVYVTAARATAGCAGSITNFRNVWAGKPLDVLSPDDLEGPECILRGTFDEFLGIPWPVIVPGATEYEPSIVFGGQPTGVTFYSDANRVRVEVHVATNASLGTYTLMVRPKNTCGAGGAGYATFQTTDSYMCSGGGMLLSVSPNPTTDELTVELAEDIKLDYTILLINKTGHVKRQLQVNQKKNTLDTTDLQNGMYYLVVKSGDKSDFRSVLIQH